MEWVEVTGKTMEEAKEAALDELGVDESDAEFEVITEAKAGLFGLMRSEARVRARVVPASARPKVERRDRRRSSSRRDRPGGGAKAGSDEPAPAGQDAEPLMPAARRGERAPQAGPRRNQPKATPEADRPARPKRPARASQAGSEADEAPKPRPRTRARTADRPTPSDREGDSQMDGSEAREQATEAAEEFLTGVAGHFSERVEVTHRELPEDIIEILVTGDDLGLLIGPKGQTLSALQELTRTVVQRKVPLSRTRIMVDVSGYREARREALERFTRQVAAEVIASGQARELEPMSAADRKVVHDTANDVDGVTTSSEGEDPARRVILSPAPGEGNSVAD